MIMGCLPAVDGKDQKDNRETVDEEYEAYTFKKLVCLLDPVEQEAVKSGFFNEVIQSKEMNLFGSPQPPSLKIGSDHQQESLTIHQTPGGYQSNMLNMASGMFKSQAPD